MDYHEQVLASDKMLWRLFHKFQNYPQFHAQNQFLPPLHQKNLISPHQK